jgi:hypothetical protein
VLHGTERDCVPSGAASLGWWMRRILYSSSDNDDSTDLSSILELTSASGATALGSVQVCDFALIKLDPLQEDPG